MISGGSLKCFGHPKSTELLKIPQRNVRLTQKFEEQQRIGSSNALKNRPR